MLGGGCWAFGEVPDINDEENRPVTVLATQDEALVAVAESLLQGAGIEYVVTNRIFQDLVGYGRLGANMAAGVIRIVVARSNAESARMVLENLQQSGTSLRMSWHLRILATVGLVTSAALLLIAPLMHRRPEQESEE